jgi:cytochrome c oxidase subunit 3
MGQDPGAASPAAHDHPPHLAHHFESPQQQLEATKLGMWLFLASEILLFGGLFCAYSVYRANHPEIFCYADRYLDRTLGGINTFVLICSSLTMAWAVRCAQIDKRRGLILCLGLTLLFGCGFLSIKYVEYQQKWKHGLLWGRRFHPLEPPPGTTPADDATSGNHPESPAGVTESPQPPPSTRPAPSTTTTQAAGAESEAPTLPPGEERSAVAPAAAGPAGLVIEPLPEGDLDHHQSMNRPKNVHIFFGIYFLMTGLHALHVIAGMSVIAWLLVRSVLGHFGSQYFTPVDLGGLYWHLVDLIWIYLFPLLYLIH